MSTATTIAPRIARRFDGVISARGISLDPVQRDELYAEAAGAPDPLTALATKLDSLFPSQTKQAMSDETSSVDATGQAELLELLAARLSPDQLLQPGEWAALFFLPTTAVMQQAQDDHLLSFSMKGSQHQRRDLRDNHADARGASGYNVASFLAWVRTVQYRLTTLAATWATMTLKEAAAVTGKLHLNVTSGGYLDTEAVTFEASRFAELFGIDLETIITAITSGDIQHAAQYLPLPALLDWIEAKGIAPRFSRELAAHVVVLRREKAYEAEAAAKQPAKPSTPPIIGEAMTRLEESRRAEAEAEEANHRELLAVYRLILLRRNEPLETDVHTLTTVCDELEFNRADVERDCRILDRAAELEKLAANRTETARGLHAAGDLARETVKRHKAESQEVSKQLYTARAKHNEACAAPGDLRELKRDNRHLFGNIKDTQ